jgi:uncharacterized protein (DUF433 family)
MSPPTFSIAEIRAAVERIAPLDVEHIVYEFEGRRIQAREDEALSGLQSAAKEIEILCAIGRPTMGAHQKFDRHRAALEVAEKEHAALRERFAALAGGTPMTTRPALTRTRGVCGGRPLLPGTRIWPSVLWSLFADGCTVAEILREYPGLTRAQIATSRALWREARAWFVMAGWRRGARR